MNSSHHSSSQGGRRLLVGSAARAQSGRQSSARLAEQAKARQKGATEESKAAEEGEFLPEIQSSKSLRQSRLSGRRSLARASVASGSTRAKKAYELGEATLAEQIMASVQFGQAQRAGQGKAFEAFGNSREGRTSGQASGRQAERGRLGESELELGPNFGSAGYATQKIDFHGVLADDGGASATAARRDSRRGSHVASTSVGKGTRSTGKVNAWETFEVNQFKVRNQAPAAIIDRLRALTAQRIPIMGELPPESELDSTDALDSLLVAFEKIVDTKATDFTDAVRRGLHLATGTRTDYCEALLKFVCHHQKLEAAFGDSVEFFMESLTSVVKLREENAAMKDSISQLLSVKEDAILDKFGLEKRLKLQIHNLDKATEQEKKAQSRIKVLQQQLVDKSAECESLQYRLRHYEELAALPQASQPVALSAGVNTGGAVPNPAEEAEARAAEAEAQRAAHSAESRAAADHARIKDLQALTKHLEEELAQAREALAQKESAEHSHRIQDLFNKLQIENKNLRIYNQKCESKLQSKQQLVNHLEEKVTQVLVGKEEAVVQLKSEIVLLKNQLELNEEKFRQRLEMQQQKLEYSLKQEYDDKIKGLEAEGLSLEKQRADLRARLTRLNQEHRELSAEFAQFRADKERQEAARNAQYQALEERIKSQQQADAARNDELKSQIAALENSSEVLQKENSILLLRQKYLKQSTATLAKQKVFLFETLAKGEGEIRETLQRLENAMLADNNNQAYLVSVEKCIKQAKKMADMGTGALHNISQILQFLKIEKLH